jgi:hypothetical protein
LQIGLAPKIGRQRTCVNVAFAAINAPTGRGLEPISSMSDLSEIGLKDQNARLDAKNRFPLFREPRSSVQIREQNNFIFSNAQERTFCQS